MEFPGIGLSLILYGREVIDMFGRTENSVFLGIDCFGQIYWLGDVLSIVSSHVEAAVLLCRTDI